MILEILNKKEKIYEKKKNNRKKFFGVKENVELNRINQRFLH